MLKVPHPYPYQGSKRNIANQILQYIPNGIETLYEPFAGSAAISLAVASQKKANHFVINDINEPLIRLLERIVTNPEVILNEYKHLWHEQLGNEKEFYNLIRDQFNQTKEPRYLYYLLARCVKAAVRYNSAGEFNQSPDNRRKGSNPKRLREQVMNTSRLLLGKTEFYSVDYKKILMMAQENDLVYMDPPYQGVTDTNDKRYIQGLDIDGFIETLEALNQKNIFYIISFDGKKGTKQYGRVLPESLGLRRLDINAGRSSQSTLLGSDDVTIESLYLSQALVRYLEKNKEEHVLEQIEMC